MLVYRIAFCIHTPGWVNLLAASVPQRPCSHLREIPRAPLNHRTSIVRQNVCVLYRRISETPLFWTEERGRTKGVVCLIDATTLWSRCVHNRVYACTIVRIGHNAVLCFLCMPPIRESKQRILFLLLARWKIRFRDYLIISMELHFYIFFFFFLTRWMHKRMHLIIENSIFLG